MNDDDRTSALDAQVERIRVGGALGRSQGLARLFDHLAARRGATLSEAEVAQDVFGRGVDLVGDASVRVYVHRLRRKLEDFYAGAGRHEPFRLTIPIGEYRLQLVPAKAPLPARARAPLRPWPWIAAAAAALVLVNLAGWAWIARQTAPARELARAAATPLWAGFGKDRPALVVIGDYYIFGDTEGGERPRRMIRAFDINSPAELDGFLMAHPEMQGRYVDIDTYYTPIGATLALREIMPLVRHLGGDSVDVVTASHLTPEMLKSSDIVYVGYLSALRLLQQPVFERSRFDIGETYDELIDRRTGRTYVSGAGAARPDRPNRDYGYLASFRGPAGNRFVVIAGARDIGVMQTAEIAADEKRLKTLKAAPVEVLYRVEGLGRTNLAATPVVVGP